MKITVLGSGGWGTALSLLLLDNGNDVTLWSFLEKEAEVLRATPISVMPRVMSRALVLSPSPMPSLTPQQRASTFFSAAPSSTGATVEGYYAALSAHQLAEKAGVEMPICECAYRPAGSGSAWRYTSRSGLPCR